MLSYWETDANYPPFSEEPLIGVCDKQQLPPPLSARALQSGLSMYVCMPDRARDSKTTAHFLFKFFHKVDLLNISLLLEDDLDLDSDSGIFLKDSSPLGDFCTFGCFTL